MRGERLRAARLDFAAGTAQAMEHQEFWIEKAQLAPSPGENFLNDQDEQTRLHRAGHVRVSVSLQGTEIKWAAFARKFRSEMAAPDASRTLDLLAALSYRADFSVGCYCEDEARCHRSILRPLLEERGAKVI